MSTTQILTLIRTTELEADAYVASADISDAVTEYKEFSVLSHDRHPESHRAELAMSAAEMVLDAATGVGYFIKFLLVDCAAKIGLSVALGFSSLAIDLIALAKQAHKTHQGRMQVRETKQQIVELEHMEVSPAELQIMLEPLMKKLAEQREQSFKNKVKVSYRTIYVVSSLLIALSFLCPPLLLAGAGLLLAALGVEHYDANHNYCVSRFFQNLGSRLADAVRDTCQKVSSAVKNNFHFFKAASVPSQPSLDDLPKLAVAPGL